MALTTDEFVAAFHAVTGPTLGTARKNLFRLLNDNADAVFDLTRIKPQTLPEQSLKLEVLNFYKSKSEILAMLQEENLAVVAKILNLDWFVKDTFGTMDGKCLVSEIFPNLSYNSKLKLLNRLSLLVDDTSKCDEFFWAVDEAYGTYLASKLLPGCSETLILKTLESYRIELNPKQLLVTIKRNPSITEEIFEKLHNYKNPSFDMGLKYDIVFKYLMQNDLPTFIRLNEKYAMCFKLGTRASRKFITNNNDDCLNHSAKLHRLLKSDQIGKCLRERFPKFFSNIFPKSFESLIDEFSYLASLLVSFKDEDKLNLMFDTFKSIYGCDLLDHYRFMVPEIFEWMSFDYKERWMENASKPKEISDEVWISFMGTEKSLLLLKEKIALTSNVKERERLVNALVSTCKINKNEDAFVDVCEYMVSKHRNDHLTVRRAFLNSTMNNFDLKKLSDRHWKYINELIRPVCGNVESAWLISKYFEGYVHVCFENDLPVTEHIKLWLKQPYISDNIFPNKREFKKRCLEEFLQVLPLCFSGEELNHQYSCYLSRISAWNKRYPQDTISIFKHEHILNTVLQVVGSIDPSDEAQEVAMHCIISDFEKASELKILETLTKSKRIYITIDVKWLFRHRPLEILPHVDSLVQYVVRQNFSNCKLREIFGAVLDTEVKKAVCAACYEIMKTGTDDYKKHAMVVLSVALTPEDFLLCLQEHCPKLLTNVDLISKFQQNIPGCLQNVAPTHLTLPIILKYCQGDLLKYAQNALHRACNNVAEKRLSYVIEVLNARAVSVRKHSIVLASKLLNKAATQTAIKNFMLNEKNPSLRKNLFKSIFNWFLRNPDDYLWQLVKENIETIGKDDTEAFCKLANSKRVPKSFFVRYIVFAWTTLDKLPYNGKLEEGKCRILESITPDNIASLPKDFCNELIRNNLFQKTHEKLQDALNLFTSQYLIFSGTDCADEVLTVIKKFSRVSSKAIYDFVKEFCLFFVKEKTKNVNVLNAFNSCWNKSFQPCQALENYLYIQFTLIYVDCLKNKSVDEAGGRIAQLCKSLFDSGCLDISILKEVFTDDFSDNFFEDYDGNLDENNFLFIDSIVKSGKSDACLGLALALIPDDLNLVPKTKVIYNSILDAAAHNPHPLVQIQLHRYLITK
ncbi:hypothetical protein RN001_003950 [Aquatica leii]|uniref:Uncharacterized protein n=1 Tax=Aquatica leii TaxID=1421715 RepID=A0AAN7PJ24_9COLE|nr:hypothetical protein RN001_003950 [Aquatica leii]